MRAARFEGVMSAPGGLVDGLVSRRHWTRVGGARSSLRAWCLVTALTTRSNWAWDCDGVALVIDRAQHRLAPTLTRPAGSDTRFAA